jgi:hypothetical protein
MSFSDLLSKAREADRESRTVEVTVAGELLELTFTELPGMDWASITAKHPPRLDAPVDLRYGYNVHGVCADAAKVNGVVRQGDEVVTPRVDGKEKIDEWADLIALLSGHDLNSVCDAVFALNEWLPQQRVAAAKKASTASSKKK